MAIGPGIYFNKYKDYSVDELERELEKLQEYLSSDELKKARQEEIDKGIDDNNCVTNVITEINVVNELLKRNSKGFIRKTKLDENGMEYEVEEILDLPKKISIEHIDLPILEQEKNIKKIGLILDMPIINTELNSKRIEEIKATYYYNPNRDGKSIIVGDDGSYLLTVSSAIDFEKLLEEYKNGRRNGNFNYINNKKVENINMNDERLKKIVEEVIGNNDPFWNEPVYNIVKKIIDLPEGTETTISKLLGDTSNSYNKFMFDIDKTVTKVCEKINIKLDRSKYKGAVVGLPFNIPFKKVCFNNNKSFEKCLCGNTLELIWDENQKFKMIRCPNCNNEMKFKNPNIKE